eukprot:TRINITY_DN9503_c0_g1_i2.p1 TRINITY_DN9503_c0_g1~~TRINITY_DN9503_c0_g1_i2.p1  ORF type:complete len:244 (-),score=72.24 TRINITY_DN9503_c0_g1_i2:34-765(-)
MTSDHRTWVRDQLHDLIGFVDKETVSYVASLGERCSTTTKILEAFVEAELPITPQTQAFAERLLARSSGSRGQLSEQKKREIQKANIARANERFSLLKMEEEEGAKHPKIKTEELQKSGKNIPKLDKSEKRKHIRTTTTEFGGDDEEEIDELEKDQEEKRKFEERLRTRDHEKTKNITIKGMKKEEIEETQKRLKISEFYDQEERLNMLQELRKTSRIKYLKDREEKKWKAFKADLADKEELF